MKKNTLLIFLVIISISLFAQRVEIGVNSIVVEENYGNPDEIKLWGYNSFEKKHIYAWFYGNDTIFEVYNDTVISAIYNWSIERWFTVKQNTKGGGYVGNFQNVKLIIASEEAYKVGEPIFVNLTIKNCSDENFKFLNNENLYYVKNGTGSYFSATLRNEYDILCKFPYEWDEYQGKPPTESDFVLIKANTEIHKRINISKILYDCICSKDDGLKKGTYWISLQYKSYCSNFIKISVE